MFRHYSLQGGVDALGVFSREVVGVFLFPGKIHARQGGQWLLPFPQFAERSMTGDSVNPGGKRSWIPQLRQAAVDVEPYFLQQIVGGMVIADHRGQEVVQPLLVKFDQFSEGGTVPCLAAHDQDAPVNPFGDIGHSAPA